MTAAGARAQKPVGSAAWIAAEKENMAELLEQEMEEIEYPVRHEMDWLNEHMAEIFSKGQANFTDVFKTPGKMRGKTPRTARKVNVEDSRMPLSEIFSSAHKQVENQAISPSPFIHRVVSKTIAPTSVAPPRPKPVENASQPQYPDLSQNINSFSKLNTDSGYHGMEDDDVFMSDTQPNTQMSTQPMQAEEPTPSNSQADISMSQQTTEDSFHSAQENVRARGETVEPFNMDPTPTQERNTRLAESPAKDIDSEINSTPKARSQSTPKPSVAAQNQKESKPRDDEPVKKIDSSPTKTRPPPTPQGKEPDDYDVDMDDIVKEDTLLHNFDDIGSPSVNSTPERSERVPVRKSSLSFASLPAREPITKVKGGSRVSRNSHIELPKLPNATGRPSYLDRLTGGHRTTQVALDDEIEAVDFDAENDNVESGNIAQFNNTHNTTSTQSLHERISMLGKHQAPRPTKSIPAAGGLPSTGQVAYPDLPAARADLTSQKSREPSASSAKADEDDWIKPLSSPHRPVLSKSNTADVMEKLAGTDREQAVGKKEPVASKQQSIQPERPKSSASIFSSPRPNGHQQSASTSNVPAAGSTTPNGSPRRYDGPLSASKMRLQSIMKSAKGLFTSSGSSIRLDASSPEQPRVQLKDWASSDKNDGETQPRPKSSPAKQETRRTRSSTEKEEKQRQKEMEDRQREEILRQEKAREQENQRAMQQRVLQDKSSVEPEERPGTSYKPSQSIRQQSREPESSLENSKIGLPQSKQNDRRPKPTREPMQKPKPQPVSIRVGSTLSRPMPVPSSVSSSVQDSNALGQAGPQSAPAPKQPGLKKKGSNASLQTASSTSSFKSSVSSQTQAQRKAQLANEKKREQEEQKARQKEEQKREQERKRVAQQQEEARRRAEAEKERRERAAQEDPKKVAQKQAIEQRRLENARRHERQGSQQANNEAPMSYHDKSTSQTSQSSQRNDLGATRPQSRLGSIQPYSRINPPAPNPARPPKRQPDEEAGQRPAVRKPSNVQQAYGEAKRRKTEDEHNPMQPVRPPMAPPIRHSNMRKISTLGQPGLQHQSGSSILQNGQPQRPVNAMNKFATGKIPFADSNSAAPAAHKPPAPAVQRAPAPAKASPKYPSGESIHLPEIATDSEDEDDSDSEMFPVPQWAQTKELENLLRQQDGMEVDSIFGPIAPFSLEETFKADKKIKKYRDRTSSANWSGPDGLTQEEIRKDVADRQRLRLNGGWSFNP